MKKIYVSDYYWHLKKKLEELEKIQAGGKPPILYPEINCK